MEAYFESNLHLWARFYPKEAIVLANSANEHLTLCVTHGQENLCDTSSGPTAYFHAPLDAWHEAKQLLAELAVEGVELLYMYGIGLGYFFEVALPWLQADSKRALVFFEDDLAVIKLFFSTKRASDLLQNKQVLLLYFSPGTKLKESLGTYSWSFLFQPANIGALPYYQQVKAQVYETLCHEISFESAVTKQLVEEYLNYGAAFFYNCYQNFLNLDRAYLGNKLFRRFKGIPAIICGAGPSLEKNRALLHQLQERALIFSGGSATNALNSIGLQPHFCLGIDPNAAQLQRLSTNVAFEVPFFYRSRLNHEAFKKIHAPCLYLTGSGGYAITDYFENCLGIENEEFEEGRNVITLALEVAYLMGCHPIIFVGMDLAYTDQKDYSMGVLTDEQKMQKDEMYLLERQDIFGQAVKTQWEWLAEAEWIAEWAKEHASITLYNCTEGGLGFVGIQNRPLKEVAEQILIKEQDLAALVHAEVQNSKLHVSPAQLRQAMEDMQASLVRAHHFLRVLIEHSHLAQVQVEKEHALPVQAGQAALAEIELSEEPAYEHILAMFNLVYSQFLNRELLQVKNFSGSQSKWQKALQELEINQKKLQFLSNVCLANIELIKFALSPKEKLDLTLEYRQLPKWQSAAETLHLKPMPKVEYQKTYYASGNLKSICAYQLGHLHGESIFYAENGQQVARGFFVEGKRQGEWLLHYASGALYSQQNFVKGLKEGLQLYFYENGQLKTELNYALGDMIGDVRLYASSGELVRHIQNQ